MGVGIVGMDGLVSRDEEIVVQRGVTYDETVKRITCPRNLHGSGHNIIKRFCTDR